MQFSNRTLTLLHFSMMDTEKNSKENKTNAKRSKLSATQIIMKKKFEKAYANRIKHENNLSQTIEPLKAKSFTSSMNESKTDTQEEDASLRNLSESKNTAQQLRLAKKSYSNHAIESRPATTTKLINSTNVIEMPENSALYNDNNSPNELCERLRLLMTSEIAGHAHQIEEINTIISRLHDLDVLV